MRDPSFPMVADYTENGECNKLPLLLFSNDSITFTLVVSDDSPAEMTSLFLPRLPAGVPPCETDSLVPLFFRYFFLCRFTVLILLSKTVNGLNGAAPSATASVQKQVC